MTHLFGWLTQFPTVSLAFENWINGFVNWLTVAAGPETNFVAKYLGDFLLWLQGALVALPWPVVVLVLGGLGWRAGGWKLGAGIAAAMAAMGVMGLWALGMDTLALVVTATLISIAVGIPVGIAMARSAAVDRAVTPFLDLMQTMPSFVYLIPALMLFGLGNVPALIATFIYAVPPVIRLTNLGIRHVPEEVLEAGSSFGATSAQLLRKVQFPVALPTILAGVNQTVMMALAMVVVASMIGAGGLGHQVLEGIDQLQVGQGFAAGLGIVILAFVIDRITQNLVRPWQETVS